MPEVERAIAVLSRVGRQLMPRTARDLPTEHRGHAVQTHHADSENCVECFKHLYFLRIFHTKAQSLHKGTEKPSSLCLCVKPNRHHHCRQTCFPTSDGVRN